MSHNLERSLLFTLRAFSLRHDIYKKNCHFLGASGDGVPFADASSYCIVHPSIRIYEAPCKGWQLIEYSGTIWSPHVVCHRNFLEVFEGKQQARKRQASIQICPRPISPRNPATWLAEPDHVGKCWLLIGRGWLSWDAEASVGTSGSGNIPTAQLTWIPGQRQRGRVGKSFSMLGDEKDFSTAHWECGGRTLLFAITSKHSSPWFIIIGLHLDLFSLVFIVRALSIFFWAPFEL